jgi:hypothetical protein
MYDWGSTVPFLHAKGPMELKPDQPPVLPLLHTCPENVLLRPLMQPWLPLPASANPKATNGPPPHTCDMTTVPASVPSAAPGLMDTYSIAQPARTLMLLPLYGPGVKLPGSRPNVLPVKTPHGELGDGDGLALGEALGETVKRWILRT